MTTSALSLTLEPPPPPPPTSDALQAFTSDRELNTSGNKCLLPVIESTRSLSKGETQPKSMTNDFLPSELLFALKRHDNSTVTGGQLYTPRKGSRLSLSPRTESQLSERFKAVKTPAKLWGYASRRGRLKHLTNAPPCICGAGKDISFLYDSPRERKETTKRVLNAPITSQY